MKNFFDRSSPQKGERIGLARGAAAVLDGGGVGGIEASCSSPAWRRPPWQAPRRPTSGRGGFLMRSSRAGPRPEQAGEQPPLEPLPPEVDGDGLPLQRLRLGACLPGTPRPWARATVPAPPRPAPDAPAAPCPTDPSPAQRPRRTTQSPASRAP